jgi:DNA (cytosine-5)-methyltransferase 1
VIRIGSLFSGIGGIELGLEWTGAFRTLWQVESDAFCRDVLAMHWPDVVRYDNVHDVATDKLAEVDMIVGGDPCQVNSNAQRSGRRVIWTSRPSFGAAFISIVDACRPALVLRENPSVVRRDAIWPWWRFRTELERFGYAVLPFRYRSCCAGAPHRRDRLFLLAALPDAYGTRLERHVSREMAAANTGRHNTDAERSDWWASASRVRRVADGLSRKVDRHYKRRLRAIGNAVVPQVSYQIGRAILTGLAA